MWMIPGVKEGAIIISDDKYGLVKAILEDEKPIETCCKCDKKASVRSYGGEAGDYCFECHFEMLERINGMD